VIRPTVVREKREEDELSPTTATTTMSAREKGGKSDFAVTSFFLSLSL
jgi:hypothetical protein